MTKTEVRAHFDDWQRKTDPRQYPAEWQAYQAGFQLALTILGEDYRKHRARHYGSGYRDGFEAGRNEK